MSAPQAEFERLPSRAASVLAMLPFVLAFFGLPFAVIAGLAGGSWAAARHLPFVTSATPFLMGLAAMAPVVLAVLAPLPWISRRYGRVEVHPEQVRFFSPFNPRSLRATVDRRSLQVVRVSPRGIECDWPGDKRLDRWLTPLFVPTRDEAEHTAALRLLLEQVPPGDPQPCELPDTRMSWPERAVIAAILAYLGWQLAPVLALIWG